MTITEPKPGLWIATACRHCGAVLTTVNEGHTDGARALWVGACTAPGCRRQWVVTTSIAAVPSRGPADHS